MNVTHLDLTDPGDDLTPGPEELSLDLPYAISEIVVAVVAIIGNALTIIVFAVDRKVHRLTNYYIVSLAVADLLVGVLGIPFALLTSLGLPKPLWACLLMLSTLLTLCTISIFCLVAVSVDRYWAIVYPVRYHRVMTRRIARRIIFGCWVAGTFVGLLPVMGWHEEYKGSCFFTMVMDYDYLVFLYFCTIVFPGFLMAFFYTHIYSVVLKQVKRSSRSEVRAAKILSIIVLFFMVSWFPLYTINCVQAFCKHCHVHLYVIYFAIILSHLNSAVNPFLYVYHMKDFRNALRVLILHRVLGRPIQQDWSYGGSKCSRQTPNLSQVNHSCSTPLRNLRKFPGLNTPVTNSFSTLPRTPPTKRRSESPAVVVTNGHTPLTKTASLSLRFYSSPNIPLITSKDAEDTFSSALQPRPATVHNSHFVKPRSGSPTDVQLLLSSAVTVTDLL